jgi:prepilin-type N-terminal cleavage/methylation domain-containing protein
VNGSLRHQRSTQRPDERGFTLVEVLVATVVMIGVLVPASLLLATSTKVLSFSQAKWVGSNLLAGVLERDRAAAEGAGTVGASGWSGTPIAPSLPSLPATKQVNGVTFSFGRTTGWCAEQTVNGVTTWANYPNTNTVVFGVINGSTVYQPPAFGEFVTVSWPGGHSVQAGQVIATPTANESISHVNPPSSSTANGAIGCPL